jgi:hypothetical protein
MIGCIIATTYGLHLSGIATRKVKYAVVIQEKFQALRSCFEKSLVALHDYLIRGSEDEKEIFKGDFEELLVKRVELKNLIAGSKVKVDPELRQILGKR